VKEVIYIVSDYYKTGKLYKKLDSYMISKRGESFGSEIYWGSSNQFKTQKKYKQWLLSQNDWNHLTFKIKKGE
jgi:hypothetical protein